MCSSKEDKGTSPSLETKNQQKKSTAKKSTARVFSRSLLNSSSNGASTGEGYQVQQNQEQ